MTLTDTARGQVFQQEGGGFLVLLTITHSTLLTPLRFVNNTENIVSNGEDFIAYPFKMKPPEDRQGVKPVARLTIDNINRQIVEVVRQIAATSPLFVQIDVVRIDDCDVIETTLPQFKLRNVDWDAGVLSGDLSIDDITKEPFPARTFTPSEYPGVFAI